MRNKLLKWLLAKIEAKEAKSKNDYFKIVDIAIKQKPDSCEFIHHDRPGIKIGLN